MAIDLLSWTITTSVGQALQGGFKAKQYYIGWD